RAAAPRTAASTGAGPASRGWRWPPAPRSSRSRSATPTASCRSARVFRACTSARRSGSASRWTSAGTATCRPAAPAASSPTRSWTRSASCPTASGRAATTPAPTTSDPPHSPVAPLTPPPAGSAEAVVGEELLDVGLEALVVLAEAGPRPVPREEGGRQQRVVHEVPQDGGGEREPLGDRGRAVQRLAEAARLGRPAPEVPEGGGEGDGVLLGAAREERALPDDGVGARAGQVGGTQPGAFAEFGEAQRGHGLAERGAVGGGTALGGDDGDFPGAVPGHGRGEAALVQPGLALEEAFGERVGAAGVDEVAGGDHAGERDPDRPLRDAEEVADA